MKHEVRITGMPAARVLISGVSVAAFEMYSINYAISGVSDSAGWFSDSTNYSAVSGGWRAGCRLLKQHEF